MLRSDPSPDHSSIFAFAAFAAAAAVWIGVMTIQPKATGLQASAIVAGHDVIVSARPLPPMLELADLSR
ncbi:hypothetical protein E0H22_15725 [Rhodopseudomonas boonkerdii]|uniref:hypothetical protein n=1 Tax=Rhodopseudomonas boonkerdii TaxID=475937 RepID=UPI001E460233|nr:hypothetical protein [Rhodopseudomonas boonkerdii]UGV27011.1 hypothetical protein E0H22_15725 [Rhodopseudomonas boonkerdii]